MNKYAINILRNITKHYPLNSPRFSLLRYLPSVPSPLEYGPFICKAGIKFVAFPPGDDYVVKSSFWFGDFDPWVTAILKKLATEGEVVCDIGANIGDTSITLARAVGSGGKVYCFEPVPFLAQCLIENLKANNLHHHSIVVPVALSDHMGTVRLFTPVGQPGMTRIVTEVSAESDDLVYNIEANTFDTWAENEGVEKVSVCKIDVEGHEEAVFRGMARSLSRGSILSILFESHENLTSQSPVVTQLACYGYVVFRIHKRLRGVSVIPVDEIFFWGGEPTQDYVALFKGSHAIKRLQSLML